MRPTVVSRASRQEPADRQETAQVNVRNLPFKRSGFLNVVRVIQLNFESYILSINAGRMKWTRQPYNDT